MCLLPVKNSVFEQISGHIESEGQSNETVKMMPDVERRVFLSDLNMPVNTVVISSYRGCALSVLHGRLAKT